MCLVHAVTRSNQPFSCLSKHSAWDFLSSRMSRWWYSLPDESSCWKELGKKWQWMPCFFVPNISEKTFGLGLASCFVKATWALFCADSNLYKQSLQHEQWVNSRLFFCVDRFFQFHAEYFTDCSCIWTGFSVPCMTFYRLFLYMDRSFHFHTRTYRDRSFQFQAWHFTDCACIWTGLSNSTHYILQIVPVCGQVLPVPCVTCYRLFLCVNRCFHFHACYRLFLYVDTFFQFHA